MLEFETLEDFAVQSEVRDCTVSIRLRRQANYIPTRFTSGPYCLDLGIGSVRRQHYGIDELRARETAARFLLEHVKGIAPPLH